MDLFFREKGEGIPLVVIHGLYGSSDNWMSIAGVLAQKFRVILIDLRNHGRSPHGPEHTYPLMVADLATLFHRLNLCRAHLLGHSMGGKVAMAFAAEFPEMVLSLNVADIAPVDYLDYQSSEMSYAYHKKILDTLYNLDLSKFSNRTEVEEALAWELPEQSLRKFLMKNLFRNPDGNLGWRLNLPVLRNSLPHIISGVNFHEFEDRMPIVSYPVHFIKGELSGYINKESLIVIRKIYPDAMISEIKGTSHLLHAEKPEEFIQVLTQRLL